MSHKSLLSLRPGHSTTHIRGGHEAIRPPKLMIDTRYSRARKDHNAELSLVLETMRELKKTIDRLEELITSLCLRAQDHEQVSQNSLLANIMSAYSALEYFQALTS